MRTQNISQPKEQGIKKKAFLIICEVEIIQTPPYDDNTGMTTDEAATYMAAALHLEPGDRLIDLTAYQLAEARPSRPKLPGSQSPGITVNPEGRHSPCLTQPRKSESD